MAWFRSDDGAPEHPKFVDLSDAAVALWWRAGCYCNRRRTDGLVPPGALRLLSRAKKPALVAAELVQAKLWEEEEGGYRFHDFADYQPTTTECEAASESRRGARQEAGRLGGLRSGEVRRAQQNEANAKQDASEATKQTRSKREANAKQNEAPIPIPIPDPRDPEHTRLAREEATEASPTSAPSRFVAPKSAPLDPFDAEPAEPTADALAKLILFRLESHGSLRVCADADAADAIAGEAGMAGRRSVDALQCVDEAARQWVKRGASKPRGEALAFVCACVRTGPLRTPNAPPRPAVALSGLALEAWSIWRDTYRRSRRGYGTYAPDAGDELRAAELAELATRAAEERAAEAGGSARELAVDGLGYVFREYLRDDGAKNFLRDNRHALRHLRGFAAYGLPWDKTAMHNAAAPPPSAPDPPAAPLAFVAGLRDTVEAALATPGGGPLPRPGSAPQRPGAPA